MIDSETEHDFLDDASFDDVIARYNFDLSLRLILFDAIEIIEVALIVIVFINSSKMNKTKNEMPHHPSHPSR